MTYGYENSRSKYLENAAKIIMLADRENRLTRDVVIDLAKIMGNYNVVSNSYDLNMIVDNVDNHVEFVNACTISNEVSS